MSTREGYNYRNYWIQFHYIEFGDHEGKYECRIYSPDFWGYTPSPEIGTNLKSLAKSAERQVDKSIQLTEERIIKQQQADTQLKIFMRSKNI